MPGIDFRFSAFRHIQFFHTGNQQPNGLELFQICDFILTVQDFGVNEKNADWSKYRAKYYQREQRKCIEGKITKYFFRNSRMHLPWAVKNSREQIRWKERHQSVLPVI